MEWGQLFTERSTQLVLGAVALLVLMRVLLPFTAADTPLGRLILWFWSPEARTGAVDEPLRRATLRNMDATLLALVVVLGVVRPLVLSAYYIPSQSMEPTLYGRKMVHQLSGTQRATGQGSPRMDRVLVNRYVYHLRDPQRGEIVVFLPPARAMPGQRREAFVKRLIGLPGDIVQVRDHHAWVNGHPLDEPYLPRFVEYSRGPLRNFGPFTVPAGEYLFLGDNRANSADSRAWGTVPRADLIGRAMCTFWPLVARDPDRPEARPTFGPRLLG